MTETQWSEGGYVFYTNHTSLHLMGGSTFTVNEWTFMSSCSAESTGGGPTVFAPFVVVQWNCANFTSYGRALPHWMVTIQAPDGDYNGTLLLTLPS
ncbi:MAG: hypothetical protein L3K02_00370 [Thermoplasmata archaeon]|nr:hypothetical protein [Thermoplasmata archaeon]